MIAFHMLCLIESKIQVLAWEAVILEIGIPYFRGNFQWGEIKRIYSDF